jgi:hypothetical protein
LEVIRKIWSVIFVNRINDFHFNQNISHQGQHCGRGKGTTTAVHEFIAAVETAKELKTELFVTSWDIKRAFDSVDRRLLVFSWTRLGVPEELARYLVEMDTPTVMVVKTPLTTLVHHHQGRDGLQRHGLSFEAGRGTAQGGVDSTAVYSAFTDILLCALSAVTGGEFYFSDIDGQLHATPPLSYVDDLLSLQSKAEKLQRMADVVSGFCLHFNLQLNTDKFRAFAINWGNEYRPGMTHLIIHQTNWEPVSIKMQNDGSFKHLGVMWDLSLHNTNQYQSTVNKIKLALDLACASKASARAKLRAIKSKLYNQLIYDTKFSSWTLKQYQCIDTLFGSAYRQITNNMQSFPTALMYTSSKYLGLDLPLYSESVQKAKYSDYKRLTVGSSRAQAAISSLLARILRQSGQQPVQGGSFKVTAIDSDEVWWATSLIEWLHTQHISITRQVLHQSIQDMHIQYGSITQQEMSEQMDNLRMCGIITRGELNMLGDDPNVFQSLNLEWAINCAVPVSPITVRPNQIWMIQRFHVISKTFYYLIIEIAGFVDTIVHVKSTT